MSRYPLLVLLVTAMASCRSGVEDAASSVESGESDIDSADWHLGCDLTWGPLIDRDGTADAPQLLHLGVPEESLRKVVWWVEYCNGRLHELQASNNAHLGVVETGSTVEVLGVDSAQYSQVLAQLQRAMDDLLRGSNAPAAAKVAKRFDRCARRHTHGWIVSLNEWDHPRTTGGIPYYPRTLELTEKNPMGETVGSTSQSGQFTSKQKSIPEYLGKGSSVGAHLRFVSIAPSREL